MNPENYRIQRNKAIYGLITPFKVKVTEFGTNRKLICDFLLVINSYLHHILHRFRDIAFEMSKITIFRYPSCVYSHPRRRGFHLPWDDLRKILLSCQQMAKVPNVYKHCRKFQSPQ